MILAELTQMCHRVSEGNRGVNISLVELCTRWVAEVVGVSWFRIMDSLHGFSPQEKIKNKNVVFNISACFKIILYLLILITLC